MLFEGPSSKLPTAILRPSVLTGRRRAMIAGLHRWLVHRREWLWPRAVPLLAAFVGLLLTLGAVKYLRLWAYNDNLALRMREARPGHTPHLERCLLHRPYLRPAAAEPIQIVLEPLKPGDHYIELTLVGPDEP